MLSDGGVSSAGSFRGLFRALLEQDHEIDFYGVRGFTEARSLETHPRYRYVEMRVPWVQAGYRRFGHRHFYLASAWSTVSHIGLHFETVRCIDASPRNYDCLVCLDTLNLCRSRLPTASWPQSPPQTEAAALRMPVIARTAVENGGLLQYGSLQAYYAYRYAEAKLALRASDLIFSGSPWAYSHWLEFGAPAELVRLQPYAIELGEYAGVPPPAVDGDVTFLWLGRAVPRKRLDLFLEGFTALRRRYPGARARVVGNVRAHPAAAALLDRYRGMPGLEETPMLARSEVAACFAASSVLVQPSQNENFGFAVAEALASGRPVVTGPTNGTGAYGGAAAFYFDEYTPASVANAMERARRAVLDAPERLAADARRAAREHFEPAGVATAVAEALRTLSARDRRSR
jgi:glycosyltransferase involved in cell wall biosynthesis